MVSQIWTVVGYLAMVVSQIWAVVGYLTTVLGQISIMTGGILVTEIFEIVAVKVGDAGVKRVWVMVNQQ